MRLTRLVKIILFLVVLMLVGITVTGSVVVNSNNVDIKSNIQAIKDKNTTLKKENKQLVEKVDKLKSKNVQLQYDNSQLDAKKCRLEDKVYKLKNSQESEYMSFTATAYCPCSRCNGKWVGKPTASGTTLTPGRTIAVDPNVIPLGSKVEVKGLGVFTAEDTGGKIKGNIIDILKSSHSEANKWGRQDVQLRVLE